MTSTSHFAGPLLAAAIIAAAVPALAAGPAKAAKPRPCPKGQVALTSRITGARYCAVLGGITVIGVQPLPEKPKPKR